MIFAALFRWRISRHDIEVTRKKRMPALLFLMRLPRQYWRDIISPLSPADDANICFSYFGRR